MTLSAGMPVEIFVLELVVYLLFKFENFYTSIQWVTQEAFTPLFSGSFEHLCWTNFEAILKYFSADVLNTKLVENLPT